MNGDLMTIFFWWAMLLGIGLVFLPLTTGVFGRFWDKGYIFSKILGILLISYVVWLLGSLKILPFYHETIWLVIIGFGAINYWKFKNVFRNNWKIFVFEEILFFLALTFWSIIRGYQPDIQGLEKFMDFGFVNTILRSKYFPPADMWLAGKTINYYYFGHLYSAVLTKLSGIDSAVTYNLLIATLFALSFSAAFVFGSNLIWKLKIKNWKILVIGGLFTASLLTLGGNLHPLYWVLKNHNYQTYWYPDATRFIVEQSGAADNTIHEFPIYSFVVADLHGHLLNLPMVLLFLSLVLSFLIENCKLKIENLWLPSLLLGSFYATNAWDFAIYHLIFGLVILFKNYAKYHLKPETIWQTGKVVLPVFFGSLLFFLPFHLNFKSLVGGVLPVDFHSPLWMLLVLWGFPLFITISYFISSRKFEHSSIRIFILIILTVSCLLIIFPEFFYLKDIYIHSYQRENTMFKLTYQSFVMFSLVTPAILFMIINSIKNQYFKLIFVIINFVFLFFIFRYPTFAVKSYYGLQTHRGLYGLNFIKISNPNDYQAILWLNRNITGQPVIAEAVGESYTDFARVSSNTGLPTVLGWRVHEWLWRGGFDIPGQRTGEVAEIYESADLNRTRQLLNQYQIKYIFVGDLERKQYQNLDEKKLSLLGEAVFSSGSTRIYEVRDMLPNG